MKKIVAPFLLFMLLIITACQSTEEQEEITVWSFTDEGEYAVEAFQEKYPDVKVNFEFIPDSQYETKLRSALATGIRAPDVFALEAAYLRKFIDHPSLESLSDAPYNAEELVGEHYEYIQELERDSEGVLRAVAYQGTTGGFYFRRDLAEEFLGTSDPKEVSAMIETWDDIFNLGERIHEESEGTISILPNSASIGDVQDARVEQPWVVDNELVIDQAKIDALDLVDQAIETNSLAMLDSWSPGWVASMQQGSVLFYPAPSWFLNHVLQSNAPDTSGQWGLASGPAAFSGGGTFYSIYSEGENKELAWEFVKHYGFDEEFLQNLAIDESYYTSHRGANEGVADEISSDFLAGQNYFEFFNEESEKVDSVVRTAFDGDIGEIYGDLLGSYARGNFDSKEAFWERFKRDVQTYYPELTINDGI
ncbi:ABC transporter substrate-binding protein [Alkalicoccobacillus murimartini]|uniref:ABC-type glycerol-3-phosphate transport system substrate-binding protein n=1 Tax=Alkalicoccobacillus murimartini TaxID=171685 RepID=A0ABT9YI55_9BACI|nr:ABC transporter substrate-binding protein [Alkalicoccobacillus murimartini]MDQ0207543.1 ABC-type glycerol-3-phosphate transport system substrate-binding protein [Alkalicoccobacillus murimartini]